MLVALSLACGKITDVDGCQVLPHILLKGLPRQPFQPKNMAHRLPLAFFRFFMRSHVMYSSIVDADALISKVL